MRKKLRERESSIDNDKMKGLRRNQDATKNCSWY